MSVELLIKYEDGRETESVPIAGEGTFTTYWQSLSRDLELQWVPFFQSGLPIETEKQKEDIPAILGELEKLYRYLAQDKKATRMMPKWVYNQMESSIKRLTDALARIQNDPNATGYIV